jgi:hypothetical protein
MIRYKRVQRWQLLSLLYLQMEKRGYYNVTDSSRIDKGCRHKFVAETIIEY